MVQHEALGIAQSLSLHEREELFATSKSGLTIEEEEGEEEEY